MALRAPLIQQHDDFYCKKKAFDWAIKNPENPKPVATFSWKLLDIEIWTSKQPNFLENIQGPVECFHKNLEKFKKKS